MASNKKEIRLSPYGIGFWIALLLLGAWIVLMGSIVEYYLSNTSDESRNFILPMLAACAAWLISIPFNRRAILGSSWQSRVVIPPVKLLVYASLMRLGREFYQMEVSAATPSEFVSPTRPAENHPQQLVAGSVVLASGIWLGLYLLSHDVGNRGGSLSVLLIVIGVWMIAEYFSMRKGRANPMQADTGWIGSIIALAAVAALCGALWYYVTYIYPTI